MDKFILVAGVALINISCVDCRNLPAEFNAYNDHFEPQRKPSHKPYKNQGSKDVDNWYFDPLELKDLERLDPKPKTEKKI